MTKDTTLTAFIFCISLFQPLYILRPEQNGRYFADNIFNFCILGLFLRVQLTASQHWFRCWLGGEQVTSHYLIQCWSSSLTNVCISIPRDHSGYGLCQWEELLLCNASSHWQSPLPEWSLHTTRQRLTHCTRLRHICVSNLGHQWFR